MDEQELRKLFELLVKASAHPFDPADLMAIWAARDAVDSQLKK